MLLLLFFCLNQFERSSMVSNDSVRIKRPSKFFPYLSKTLGKLKMVRIPENSSGETFVWLICRGSSGIELFGNVLKTVTRVSNFVQHIFLWKGVIVRWHFCTLDVLKFVLIGLKRWLTKKGIIWFSIRNGFFNLLLYDSVFYLWNKYDSVKPINF